MAKANPLGGRNAGISMPNLLKDRGAILAASRGMNLSALVQSLLIRELGKDAPTYQELLEVAPAPASIRIKPKKKQSTPHRGRNAA